MQPGWFPDPDNPNARRYWDGSAWSAPLPVTPLTPKPQPEPVADNPGADLLDLSTLPETDSNRNLRQAQERYEAAKERLAKLQAGDPETTAQARAALLASPTYQAAYAKAQAERAARQPAGDGQLVCPHCQAKGQVKSKQVRQKKGVSGGKATAAVLTGGVSLLGVGLSRKETATQMTCGNCKTTWQV